jgi:hypothetical protein
MVASFFMVKGMRVVGYVIWDMGYGIWDMGCGMWDVGCGMWDVVIRVSKLGTGEPETGELDYR